MIQVGFSRGTGLWTPISAIIRSVTKRAFSHTFLLCTGEHAYRGMSLALTEDEHGGLHFLPWGSFPKQNNVVVTMLDPPYDLGPGLDALLPLLGTDYDFSGLVGEGWVFAMQRWFHRKVKNPIATAGEMWCSESVYFAMSKVSQFGIASGTSVDVDPGFVYDALLKSGAKPSPGYSLV